jgi:Protein of unknown function (DUF2637)
VNRGDRAIRVLTTLAVLVVAGIAAVISFVHIEHLALTHGQTVLAAMLLPLSIDGTVAASSLVMLRLARLTLPTPKLARCMLVLAVLATLACNVLFGGGFGIVGALLGGWPALAFIGCAELAIGMIRRARTAPEAVAETVADVADYVPVGAPMPIPMPCSPSRQCQQSRPVADGASDSSVTPQARGAGHKSGAQAAPGGTPRSSGAERAFAGHVEAGQFAVIIKNRLKRIQYRPALIERFLAQTGLTLEPQPP